MKKLIGMMLSCTLLFSAVGLAACNSNQSSAGLSAYDIYCRYHPNYKGTEEEWINALANGELAKSYTTEYNIIFTLATVPPVLAALESIASGNQTYAFIERGKTYSGIESASDFYNIGFDVSDNTSTGFNDEKFTQVVNQVKELNVYGNEKFNIYVCDYSALLGFGVAANAMLQDKQYQIILCENGGSTYDGLKTNYIKQKTVDANKDEPYSDFLNDVSATKAKIKKILTSNQNKFKDFTYGYDIAFSAATLDNVTYLLQDKVRIQNYLEELGSADRKTKLLSVFGCEGYNEATQVRVNLQSGTISEKVAGLSSTQKRNYLKLMYGAYFDDTYNALMRTTLPDDETPVPHKKLVFIGSRAKSYPDLAAHFGYATVTDASQVPDSYSALNSVYKTDFLFTEEADYQLFINQLNRPENYEDDTLPSQDILDAIKVSCFNYYMSYLLTLKFTYLQYHDEFDILLKGHPSEVLGEHNSWTQHYEVEVNSTNYRYDKLYDNLLLAFHSGDSVGKFIGLLPFGTAAENLAYLGADISLCGLPSATYTGYDPSVDIKFVLSNTNSAVDADTNLNGRFADGTLIHHDKNGKVLATSYINIGNLYKKLIAYYTNSKPDASYRALYEEKLAAWLRSANSLPQNADLTGYDVDEQGFLLTPAS